MSAPPSAGAHGLDPLSPLTREHFTKLDRAGRFGGAALGGGGAAIVSGEAGREASGTRVRFELRVAGDRVEDARFLAYGCPHTLAISNWIAGELIGRRRAALVPGAPADWAARFEVPAPKLGRLLVIEDALRACLTNWPGPVQ